jgi:L-ascorbate metabolism protein UlaG (beta-lactamase superfamily)
MASVKITFIGHASFRFESEKSVTYFDPWLDSNPTAKMTLGQVKKADIVIASHGHRDHIGDSYEVCKKTKAKFVGNYELCVIAQEVHKLKMGSRALSMNPGGTVKVKDASITMVQGHHSQSLSTHVTGADLPAGLLFHPDSAVNGFCVAYDNGITIYDTADTCLFSDMQLIGQMYGPQVAIMPVGGQYTMGIREAARAASLIRPDVVIPCHYGPVMGQPADIGELKKAVKFLSPNTEVVELEVGQTLTYTASSHRVR